MNILGRAAAGSRREWQKRHTLVVLAFFAAFICYIDRVSISVGALPMQQAFQWTETTKGIVLSSFFVGYLISQIPSGIVASRLGGRNVLGFAVLWWSLFTLLTPLAAAISLPVLLAVRIGMGLGEGAMFPAAYNLFARWVPQAERSRSVGFMLSGVAVGTLFALGSAGWIVNAFGWHAIFYIFGSLGVIWAIFWFTAIPRHEPAVTGTSPKPQSIPWKELFSKPAVWALLINHFCSNWTFYLLLSWLPSYFVNVQKLSLASASLFSAVPWSVWFVMTNVAAWTADALIRNGVSVTAVRKVMQTVGLLGSGAFLIMTQNASSVSAALLLVCLACAAHALTGSGMATNHLDIAPRHADVLMGITNTIGSLPGAIGVALTGWLIETSGSYTSAFALAAIINIFGVVVWLAFASGRQLIGGMDEEPAKDCAAVPGRGLR